MKDFSKHLEIAKQLPTHINGELQPTYTFNGLNKLFYIMYHNFNIDSIFYAVSRGKSIINNANGYFYTKIVTTYRADGSIRPKSEWIRKVYYHKKWARRDIEVTEVKFNIVGYKRESSKLPAGVVIADVEFVI